MKRKNLCALCAFGTKVGPFLLRINSPRCCVAFDMGRGVQLDFRRLHATKEKRERERSIQCGEG